MKYLMIFICLITFQNMASQALSKYQWENRIVLILTESPENEKLQQQVDIFEKEINAFKERKLVLLHSFPGKHQVILPEKSDFIESSLYKDNRESNSEFEVLLIGLDGGVKLRQNEILETEKLFSLIDSMPMRQAEMKKN